MGLFCVHQRQSSPSMAHSCPSLRIYGEGLTPHHKCANLVTALQIIVGVRTSGCNGAPTVHLHVLYQDETRRLGFEHACKANTIGMSGGGGVQERMSIHSGSGIWAGRRDGAVLVGLTLTALSTCARLSASTINSTVGTCATVLYLN